MYHSFIVGKKVYLRGLEKKDLSGDYFQWTNDAEVTYFMFSGATPNYLENLEEEYDRVRKSNNEIVLLVVDKKTDKPIGCTGLYMINWISRSAEYRIIVGEKDFWDKSYGAEIGDLMLQYAFDKLNLNKIWLGVNAENIRAVKSYEKTGFVREGVLRKEIYRNSKYYDAVRMSILREEYCKKNRK